MKGPPAVHAMSSSPISSLRTDSQAPDSRQRRWLVRVTRVDQRTMTGDELVDAWRSGFLNGGVKCRTSGSLDWIALREIPEVRARLDAPSGASAPPHRAVAPPPAIRETLVSAPPHEPLTSSRRRTTVPVQGLHRPDASPPDAVPSSIAEALHRYVADPQRDRASRAGPVLPGPMSTEPTEQDGADDAFPVPSEVVQGSLHPMAMSQAPGPPTRTPHWVTALALVASVIGVVAIGRAISLSVEGASDAPGPTMAAAPATASPLPGPVVEPAATRTDVGTPQAVPTGTPQRSREGTVKRQAVTREPFDPVRGMTALNEAARTASQCSDLDGPSGTGSAQVTFDPSTGSVSSAILLDPFANTRSGACVVERLRSARVAPFSGDPVSATVSFHIPAPGPQERREATDVRQAPGPDSPARVPRDAERSARADPDGP